MILACQGISKAFAGDEVIKNASFQLEAGEKAALVGSNGAGKTTLLRIIMKELSSDAGEVILAKGASISYLPQNPDVSGNRSIYEEAALAKEDLIQMGSRLRAMESEMGGVPHGEIEAFMERYHILHETFESLGGLLYQSEIVGVLKGLGFSEAEFEKPMEQLSGGQRTRVCLGKLLIAQPDVLLLDEPTNHLDIASVSWLEGYLANFRGAVLVVSHDRYFSDRVVGKVLAFDMGMLNSFSGNYTDYAQKSAALWEARLARYKNQEKEIKRQEEVIAKLKSFNREKSIKRAESREKMLAKKERMDAPKQEKTDMNLSLNPGTVSGNDVLRVEDVSKAFSEKSLFSKLSFEIKRGERIALLGDNGTGKTTILKIIGDQISADAGSVNLGANVCIGYYDQEHQVLHMEKNLMEEIADAYPKLTVTRIRNVLAAFLFLGDDVFKRVGDLSGGERGRLSLAKLMLSEANFLILDEPTNHLDMASKEILEQALSRYTGTVLFVSHDRYFINQTATRILNLSGGVLTGYLGNYDYFLEKRQEREGFLGNSASVTGTLGGAFTGKVSAENGLQGADKSGEDSFGNGNSAGMNAQETAAKEQWLLEKERQARQRKQASDLKRTEEQIEAAEEVIRQLEEQFLNPALASNSAELNRLHKEYEDKKVELEAYYEAWEVLAADVV